jgi:hypothetical protein
VLAGPQALYRLLGMHLGWGAEDDGIDAGEFKRFTQVGARVRHAVLVGNLAGRFKRPAHQADNFDPVNVSDSVQVFDAESAGTCENDFHGCKLLSGAPPPPMKSLGHSMIIEDFERSKPG